MPTSLRPLQSEISSLHWSSPKPCHRTKKFDNNCYTTISLTILGRLFVKRFALCYWTVVLSCPVCVSVTLSVTLVYCGQTVGWIKIKLVTQVGPGHIVLDGDPGPPPPKGHSPSQFSAHIFCGQMARCIQMALGRKTQATLC